MNDEEIDNKIETVIETETDKKIDIRKRNITIIAVLGVVVIAVLCTIMFILPGFDGNKIAKAGETVIVSVYAPKAEDVYGYELKIHYNKENAEYIKDELKSSISSITTIFAKEIESHILVGATMIGPVEGYTADQPEMCTLSFKVLKDFDLSELTMDGVGVVKSDLEYIENIDDWKFTTTIAN